MVQEITIDAKDQVLGRLATKVADLLRGKDRVDFQPNKIPDRKIIVENAGSIKVTGQKLTDKVYYRHSMYPGAIKGLTLQQVLERHPKRALEWAVYGMLPKNRLRAQMMKNLILR